MAAADNVLACLMVSGFLQHRSTIRCIKTGITCFGEAMYLIPGA